jgi:diguanylate cyclase (GGDEF)-like protein
MKPLQARAGVSTGPAHSGMPSDSVRRATRGSLPWRRTRGDLTRFVASPALQPWVSRLPGDLAKLLVVALAYYVTGVLSLRLALVGGQVTPIWPPTGIALVGLLLFGRRVWPGIALGALLVNAPISRSLLDAAGITGGNTLAPLLAASLLIWVGFRTELDRLRDAMAIVFIGALGMTVSATGGTTTLVLSGSVSTRDFWPTWWVWWAGDAMGILLFAPFLLSLRSVHLPWGWPWRRWTEAATILLGTAGVTYGVFQSRLHIQYLVFPFLGWAAWRFRQRGAAPAALLTSGLAIWAAVKGTGPFAEGTLQVKMVTLQVFNASVAFASFFLAAVRAERLQNSAERERAEHELAHQALHDPLTGLANRMLLIDRLTQALARSERRRKSVAVMFLDLDRFKVINDSLGHETGDRVLVCVADRLRRFLRPEDSASRLGGDEFVVLCEDLASERDAIDIAERLAQSVQQPIALDTGELVVTTSIGVALGKAVADSPEALVRDADAAMYQAKDGGRARYELFDSDTRVRAVKRLKTENELRRAIDAGGLRLHYQPLVRLGDQRIAALEALVRWQHPERGLLPPAEFIPVAEETGLIAPLGAWVLEEACRQSARWQQAAPEGPPLRIAVNVSVRQLDVPQFEEAVRSVLAETGIDPMTLSLELTETVLMEAAPPTLATLRRLRELGVRLAIDDFGTGYSSLSYLKRFQVDTLKVDRSFVKGLGVDPEDSAIVAAVVSLAHNLGLSAVAEGVETTKQLNHLRLLDCDLAQGYYFAYPQPAEAVEKLFSRALARVPS